MRKVLLLTWGVSGVLASPRFLASEYLASNNTNIKIYKYFQKIKITLAHDLKKLSQLYYF